MKVRILLMGLAVAVGFMMASTAMAQDNHYLCRKVKDLKIPAKFDKNAHVGHSVVDETGADTCDLKKLFLLCQPADKDGSGIPDPALNYCCYKAKCGQKPATQYGITDQFGPLSVETKKPFLLCNPCVKAPI